MRVLFLTERYPPHYTGGYEIACHAVAERARALGHDVRVLTSNYGLAGRLQEEGHVARRLHRAQDSPSLLGIARWEQADNAALAHAIDAHRPDVIYAWSLQQLFASLHRTLRRSGVPVVLNIQDVFLGKQLAADAERAAAWRRPGRGLHRLVKPLLRRVLSAAQPGWGEPLRPAELCLEHLVFVSEFQRAQHLAAGLPAGDFRIVRNGVELRRFELPRPPREGPLRALFVGRLVAEKGAHVALRAVERLATRGVPVELTIAGIAAYPLDYGRALEATAAASGGRVRFVGAVAQEDLPALYARHDALVFPSRHREGLPMTVLEALASRLALVATATGGTAEILGAAELGLEVPEEDPDAVADALERLALEADLAPRLGRNGRAWVEANCALERVVIETLEYLSGAAEAPC